MSEAVVAELKANIEPSVTEIESLCFHCYKSGITRLLLVRIAFFREVVVSSFTCPHCGFENRSLDTAAPIQDKGQRFTLLVKSADDLNRRVVRPAGSTVLIPEFDASFPTSDGDLSTVEGVICGIADIIDNLQPERMLDEFVRKLRKLLLLENPFTLVLDDASGNGCIENPLAPNRDPQLEIVSYDRTGDQNAALGFATAEEMTPQTTEVEEAEDKEPSNDGPVGTDEVLKFGGRCPNCNHPSETNMKLVDIPYFKKVVIMATVCSNCGHKDSEVKSGGGISPLGRFYRLNITHPTDLSRDILISETAGVHIPDLELESAGGTLGGRFSTVEGMLLAIRDQLIGANPFVLGDSATDEEQQCRFATVIRELSKIAAGERLNVVFELKDPAGNSYLQNLYAPDPDPQLHMEDYERSVTEDDELGILDMKTINYEEKLPSVAE